MQPINFKFSNEFTRKGVSTKRFDFSKVLPCKVEDEMNALRNQLLEEQGSLLRSSLEEVKNFNILAFSTEANDRVKQLYNTNKNNEDKTEFVYSANYSSAQSISAEESLVFAVVNALLYYGFDVTVEDVMTDFISKGFKPYNAESYSTFYFDHLLSSMIQRPYRRCNYKISRLTSVGSILEKLTYGFPVIVRVEKSEYDGGTGGHYVMLVGIVSGTAYIVDSNNPGPHLIPYSTLISSMLAAKDNNLLLAINTEPLFELFKY